MNLSEQSAHLFADHGDWVWGLGYRMLGSAAEADDLVQDTFARLLDRPPRDRQSSLIPWLTRVAMNLARDRLRRRRRRAYVGTWLPEPVLDRPLSAAPRDAEGRYAIQESATLAFLVALEALTPSQRAVLLLREVLDCSVRETADALEMSESNVKVTLHRARKALASYDQRRRPVDAAHAAALHTAMMRFSLAAGQGDLSAAMAAMDPEVLALSDGGGVVSAATRAMRGAEAVSKLYLGLMRHTRIGTVTPCIANGLPARRFESPNAAGRLPKRSILQLELAPDGRIARVFNVLNPAKLTEIR